jgi:acetyl-CoA carboxylase biotin carboxyl carrier protein
MDFKKIKRLVALVENSKISALSVEENGLKINIKREMPGSVSYTVPSVESLPVQSVLPSAPEPVAQTPVVDATLIPITSPMVGTFYASPNPESPPFVAVGASVSVGAVVCIIEAMKLFNELESEVSGVIDTVCVANGDPVEFGQTLFLVRPK